MECSTWYLKSERSEWERYQVEHSKRNSTCIILHIILYVMYAVKHGARLIMIWILHVTLLGMAGLIFLS